MDAKLTWMIAGFGTLSMVGVLWRMGPGFGPFNLRAVGIVLIATFSSLLALHDDGSFTAAMGILGAIGGYLFGLQDFKGAPKAEPPTRG